MGYGQSYGNFERSIVQAIADQLIASGIVIGSGTPSNSGGQHTYSENFTQAYLDNRNQLLVNHGRGSYPRSVAVFDNKNERIHPDNIVDLDANALKIELTSFVPLSGTYRVLISP